MIGFPKDLRTRQDYLNACEYVQKTGEGAELLIARLEWLKATTTAQGLKAESWSKRAEKQQQSDYEPVADVNCEMYRLGFTAPEIEKLIGGLKRV